MVRLIGGSALLFETRPGRGEFRAEISTRPKLSERSAARKLWAPPFSYKGWKKSAAESGYKRQLPLAPSLPTGRQVGKRGTKKTGLAPRLLKFYF